MYGEWTNYTVRVKMAGRYKNYRFYGGAASALQLEVDNQPPRECKLPVDTASPHKPNKTEIGEISFAKPGLHLLSLHCGENDLHNNLAYLEFALVR